MRAIKTLTCALAAATALALGTSVVRAVSQTTTNSVILTFNLTISTNSLIFISDTNYAHKVTSVKLTNKNLLALLGGSDFANENLSNDQIAIAYDAPWNGDVVVVDKTGSNVLYDATFNYGNSNNATLDVNLVTINSSRGRGTQSVTFNYKPSGTIGYTIYNNGTFTLLDNTNNINISGSGSSTVTFAQTFPSGMYFNPTNAYTGPWTDSATFKFFGANNQFGINQTNVTISGTITAKGKGRNGNTYFLKFIIS